MSEDKTEDPDPRDVAAWRQIVIQGGLGACRLESVVAAIQDIGPDGDKRVVQGLVLHISDTFTRMLRRMINRRNPNEGLDIIDDAYGKLIDSLYSPSSADGAGLREAFVPRVEFRAADAIRRARRHLARYASSDEEGVVPPDKELRTASCEGALYVEQMVMRIEDERKRLAIRLHLEGVPISSSRTHSIARALGVSARTAGEWISEVKEQMELWLGEKE